MNASKQQESEQPKRVCLCGSSKWPMIHHRVMMDETLAGRIVIPMGLYGHADYPPGAKAATNDGDESTEVKQMLDRLHYAKIDAADEVLVVRVNGYIGSSTKREIEHAASTGKLVRYFDATTAPATPSADEEIERTVFKCTACGKKEDITAIIAQSHDFVREDYLNALNAIAAIVSPATEFQCGMDYVVAVEQYAADTLQTEQALAAREGELARAQAARNSNADDRDAALNERDRLKSELATAQTAIRCIVADRDTLRSQLTEAQRELSRSREEVAELSSRLFDSGTQLTEAQKLISDNHLVIEGLGDDLKEANAKLAGLESVIDFIRDAVFRIHGDSGVQKVDIALTRLGGSK